MRLINLDSILKEANFIRVARGANALGGAATVADGLTQRSEENLENDPSYLSAASGAGDIYQAALGNTIAPRTHFGPDFLSHTPPAASARPPGKVMTAVNKVMPAIEKAAPFVGQVGKTLGKAAPFLKGVGKAVPFVGSATSAYNAYQDYQKGDYTGMLMNAASGAAGLLPGVGSLIASPLIDAANYGRQTYNSSKAGTQLNKAKQDAARILNGGPRTTTPQQNAPAAPQAGDSNFTGPVLPQAGDRNFIGPVAPPQNAPVSPQQNAPAANKPVNIPPASLATNSQATQAKIGMLMDKISSQFKQDLENPGAGTSSDLYEAISPLISNPDNTPKNKADAKRVSALQDNVRKGLVGLEYMTGMKHNEGETFYDKHPAQAVATDVASKALPIGAAVAGGGILADMMRQWRNLKKTEQASDSREGNSKQNPTSAAQLADPDKRARPDISKVFGDYSDNLQKRLQVLDGLNKSTGPRGLHAEYIRILGDSSLSPKMREAQIKQLVQYAKNSGAATALNSYINVHQSLEHANTKGGLKGAIGESLQGLKGKGRIRDFLSKLAPGTYSELGDLFEKNKITGANPFFDEDLVKSITAYNKGGGDFGILDPKGKSFLDTTLERLKDKKLQASGLRKGLHRAKLPLVAGGAAAAGLGGLYGLLKLIQNQSYSNDKRKDWKKTLLKSRGEFEEADKIQ